MNKGTELEQERKEVEGVESKNYKSQPKLDYLYKIYLTASIFPPTIIKNQNYTRS